MKVIKGLLCFLFMILLSICITLWVSLNIVGKTVLSSETNIKLLAETEFTSEVVAGVLNKYNTNMGQLRFEEEDLMNFVDESSEGVVNYVFLKRDAMPSVNVLFIKEYIHDIIIAENSKALYGQLAVDDFVKMLREIPEGESISMAASNYLNALNIVYENEEFETVLGVYIDNKEATDETLIEKITNAIKRDVIDIESMKTELSLQALFDQLMEKNPFTLIREFVEVFKRNVNGYLLLTLILIALMILIIEFSPSKISLWFALALVLSLIPLQIIRLADFMIDRDFLNLFGGMSSYSDYMLNVSISKLNTYTYVLTGLIVVLFIFSKLVKGKADSKSEGANKHIPIRIAASIVLLIVFYINFTGAYAMNLKIYEEVTTLEASDFDIKNIDLTLRELLNVDYDF